MGRPGETERVRHHAEFQGIWWRSLELPGGLGQGLKQPGGSDQSAQSFVQKLYKNVPVLDSGARDSTTKYLYTDEDQNIAARNFYRPSKN